MQRVTGIVRGVAGSFEQTTTLRVTALERLGADQLRRNEEILGTLVETEAERETARASIATLNRELQHKRDQVQRLAAHERSAGQLAVELTALLARAGQELAPAQQKVANEVEGAVRRSTAAAEAWRTSQGTKI